MSLLGAVVVDRSMGQATDRRGANRDRVIKSAQMIFHDSVIDCIVMDISADGAKVRTSSVVVVPEQLVLQLRGGASFFARRTWSRGLEISFAFDGSRPLAENATLVALSALEALRAKGLGEATRILRAAGFFEDPVLGQAAEDAEAAYARFEAALTVRAKHQS